MITTSKPTVVVPPGSFEPGRYWYEKAYNATIHPLLNSFLQMNQAQLMHRYCQLRPLVNAKILADVLNYRLQFFRWSGADLLHVTTDAEERRIILIENNSCPSGQKSMPPADSHYQQSGYYNLIKTSFKPFADQVNGCVDGGLAVICDKNEMENVGYAATIADLFGEDVFLATYRDKDPDPTVRFINGLLEIRDTKETWNPIRCAFRYVTQKPWNRIPVYTKTGIFNPVIACLAGGRNKLVASKAYEIYNAELADSGLKIHTPETIWDVSKNQIPIWVKKLGGYAVVKVPYSNAGQGVYTIASQKELAAFMNTDFEYEKFIVQGLIGNHHWTSVTRKGKMYHVGMLPNNREQTFVFDLRMMVCSTQDGIRPLAVYSRRAAAPLKDTITNEDSSWSMLGTNLSSMDAEGEWQTDTSRLLLMDKKDFNSLGLGLDDLIEAFVQTILSTIAIDKMTQTLLTEDGHFRYKLFQSLDDDAVLMKEILPG